MKTSVRLLALTIAACTAGTAFAASTEASAPPQWTAWGGTVGLRFNPDLLGDLGIAVRAAEHSLPASAARLTDGLQVRQAQAMTAFDLRRDGSIAFRAERGSFAGFLGGAIQARGGFRLELPDGSMLDLTDFRLQPNPADAMRLDLADRDGTAWFTIDHMMYEMVRNRQVLAVYTADVRASRALAERVGRPELVGHPVADVELLTEVRSQGTGGDLDPQGNGHWHGEQVDGQPPGTVYEADLFMQHISVSRMRQSGTSGHEGNGRVVFAPDSTLRNNLNNGSAVTTIPGQGALGTSSALWTARIPWYGKFSGNFAPYNNDQHPFLIWNMYRINADGGIEQIGRSGVKHAWLTTNWDCAPGENISGQILGRGCSDTYSTFNNDDNSDLSFRSEIIPATNQWGRCGSLFDPTCVGSNTNTWPDDDDYVRRLVVNESQISPTRNPGATYLFDSWYLARQDINIYNSMASVTGTPTYSGGNWSFAGQGNYRLGSVTDRWVEGAPSGTVVANTELAVAEGHAKVAVRVVDLGNGQWTYHYAVHNLDFSRAVTEGSEPNLRVLSNRGFSSFSVPVETGAVIGTQRFSDGDLEAGNDWAFSTAGGRLTWTAPAGQSLDWGTLYLFSVTVGAPPTPGQSRLDVAQSGSPAFYDVAVPVPGAQVDVIFGSGFE